MGLAERVRNCILDPDLHRASVSYHHLACGALAQFNLSSHNSRVVDRMMANSERCQRIGVTAQIDDAVDAPGDHANGVL